MSNKMSKQVQTIINGEGSKSSKMVQLYLTNELTIKQISELMGTRYNFVYNVVSNYCTINSIPLNTKSSDEVSKKDLVIEQYLQGNTLKVISINLKTNYNYVHKIVSEYKKSLNEQIESV